MNFAETLRPLGRSWLFSAQIFFFYRENKGRGVNCRPWVVWMRGLPWGFEARNFISTSKPQTNVSHSTVSLKPYYNANNQHLNKFKNVNHEATFRLCSSLSILLCYNPVLSVEESTKYCWCPSKPPRLSLKHQYILTKILLITLSFYRAKSSYCYNELVIWN